MAKSIRACRIWEYPAVWLSERAGRANAHVKRRVVWEAGSDRPGSPEGLASLVILLSCPPREALAQTSLNIKLQGLSRFYRSSTCLRALQESCLLVVRWKPVRCVNVQHVYSPTGGKSLMVDFCLEVLVSHRGLFLLQNTEKFPTPSSPRWSLGPGRTSAPHQTPSN